jgi:hypothetical protein
VAAFAAYTGIPVKTFYRLMDAHAPSSLFHLWKLDGAPFWATDTNSLDTGKQGYLEWRENDVRQQRLRNLVRWIGATDPSSGYVPGPK